jgi:hypothetical protein
LEQGSAHTVPKVRAVYNALEAAGSEPLDADAEILPQRFLPNCRTLREGCKLSVSALATQAEVDRSIVEKFEHHHGGTLADAQAVFAVLSACTVARGGRSLNPDLEISLGPNS